MCVYRCCGRVRRWWSDRCNFNMLGLQYFLLSLARLIIKMFFQRWQLLPNETGKGALASEQAEDIELISIDVLQSVPFTLYK